MHKLSKAYADVLRRIKNSESEQYQLTKLLSFLYCSVNPNKEKTPNLPTGGWCAPETVKYNFDGVLAKSLVEKVFTGQSVGEFGSGKGHYSKYFQKTKKLKSVKCYDGAGNIEQVTKGFVTHLDLSKEHHDLPMFDWVLSTEVGEHIPAKFEDVYIRNLHRFNTKGIVLSWKIPNPDGSQSFQGRGHVNEKSNSYIKAKMAKLGYWNNLDIENYLRKNSNLNQWKTSLMVFERKRIEKKRHIR